MSYDPDNPVYLDIDDESVKWVDREIFLLPFADDCMTHECRCKDEGDRVLLDACCQHGADVDLFERDRILERKAEIAPVLREEFRDPARWFDEREPEEDPDQPSGTVVRTGLVDLADENSGCVFLQHDARGCALHRAALANDFDPASIKPAVCRLYPLTWGEQTIGLSDDYFRYSCAFVATGPSVYQIMRPTIISLFGHDLVRKLDALEREVVPRRLPLYARG